jgi:RHS repeat-associated protein
MSDGLGSIRNLVDGNEDAVNVYDYYAFGKELGSWTENVTNRYTYTAREYDGESEQYYYRARYYDGGGRFNRRDPARDGLNLFVYVRNRATVFRDANGLWYSGTHKDMVDVAISAVWGSLLPEPTKGCRKYVEKTLKKANVDQDDGYVTNSPPFTDLRRHYNSPEESKKALYDREYGIYLGYEWSLFHVALGPSNIRLNAAISCTVALKAMGRVSHSEQDFYEHAVLKAELGGGWKAWTRKEGKITGSPYNRGSFDPCTWPDEHGGLDEFAAEKEDRRAAAQTFTNEQFASNLPTWYSICNCYCNSQ